MLSQQISFSHSIRCDLTDKYCQLKPLSFISKVRAYMCLSPLDFTADRFSRSIYDGVSISRGIIIRFRACLSCILSRRWGHQRDSPRLWFWSLSYSLWRFLLFSEYRRRIWYPAFQLANIAGAILFLYMLHGSQHTATTFFSISQQINIGILLIYFIAFSPRAMLDTAWRFSSWLSAAVMRIATARLLPSLLICWFSILASASRYRYWPPVSFFTPQTMPRPENSR